MSSGVLLYVFSVPAADRLRRITYSTQNPAMAAAYADMHPDERLTAREIDWDDDGEAVAAERAQ